MSAYVVKRGSHDSEPFEPLKLHASILAACRTVRAFEGEAHNAAEHVCRDVIDWIEDKTEVTTDDIRRVASSQLAAYHPEASYMYKQHRMII